MSQSLALLPIHIIFSTKDRAPVLGPAIAPRAHAYLATVSRSVDCPCFRVGGMPDHVHLAIGLSRTITVADLVMTLKGSSSKWLKQQSAGLKDFAWQQGYGAFSVGPKNLEALCQYIAAQEEHHKARSFQDEFLRFLKKYNIPYDERYIWS